MIPRSEILRLLIAAGNSWKLSLVKKKKKKMVTFFPLKTLNKKSPAFKVFPFYLMLFLPPKLDGKDKQKITFKDI